VFATVALSSAGTLAVPTSCTLARDARRVRSLLMVFLN
jgi:hypothetical protein